MITIIEWKEILGYEGYYSISSNGDVFSHITNKLIIGDKNQIGYKRVTLYIPIKKRFFVHRLVALHFVDGYSPDLVVNHIDGNKTNNNYVNLEWITRSENDLHAFRLKLRKPNPSKPKYKVLQYDLKTNETIKIYNNVQEASNELHVSRSYIYSTCNKKYKSCKGYGLQYC